MTGARTGNSLVRSTGRKEESAIASKSFFERNFSNKYFGVFKGLFCIFHNQKRKLHFTRD